jgi:hypothetical protein
MRKLKSYNEQDAEKELRDGEVLIPSGGITVAGYDLKFFSAASDESFLPKEERLILRRANRKRKKASN